MATTTTITKLLFRRGNDADRKKTILASGEPGFALDTGRFYIGDGSTPGGHPVIAVSDWHLSFVDDIGEVEGDYSRHKLDLYVPGLSATLAGDRREPEYLRYPKLFHPTDRILRSDYPLELTGANDINAFGSAENHSILFTGEVGNPFTINRLVPGEISIGDGLLVLNTATDSISLGNGGAVTIDAEAMTFANGVRTHFEDNSIDLNVPIDDSNTVITPDAAQTITSENTGLFFAHSGYLSAGGVYIGQSSSPTTLQMNRDKQSWNTITLAPTVYMDDWVSSSTGAPAGSVGLENRLKGIVSYGPDKPTSGPMPGIARFSRNNTENRDESKLWGGVKGPYDLLNSNFHNNMGDVARPKPIHIQSVRPAGNGNERATNVTNYTSVYEQPDVSGVPSKVHVTSDYEGVDITNRGQPNPWDGNVNLVFETGLVVYGPGDRDIQPAYNGYLINQSLDSYSVPTFQGMVIEGPNSQPMQVSSGGTGRNDFFPGALLAGNGNTDKGQFPLHEVRCPQRVGANGIGILSGTTNSAVVSASMVHNPPQWWGTSTTTTYTRAANADSSGTGGGQVTLTNLFAPNSNTVQNGWDTDVSNPRQMFFDKFVRAEADAGAPAQAARFDAGLRFKGDTNNMVTKIEPATGPSVTSKPANGGWQTTYGPKTNISWNHVEHAALGGAFSAGAVNGDISTLRAMSSSVVDGSSKGQFAQESTGSGMVISAFDLNKAGHIRQVYFKDFDYRYSRATNMGGVTSRAGSRLQLPTLNGAPISTSTGLCEMTIDQYANVAAWDDNVNNDYAKYWLQIQSGGSGPSGGSSAQVINNIVFNDYGTVKSIQSADLRNVFFNKREIGDIVHNIGVGYHTHQLNHENWPLRKDISSATTANVTTSWNNTSKIAFSEGGSQRTRMSQINSSQFLLDTDYDLHLQTGSERAFRLTRNNSSYEMITAGTGVSLYYAGGINLSTTSTGITLHNSGDPATKGDGVTQMTGCSQYSVRSKYAYVQEDDSNDWHSMVFTPNNAGVSGYDMLRKDDGIVYNASSNILKTLYFQGDGRLLDMTHNTTIPPTVELQSAGNAYYRVVGCTTDRHKIYDKDNTVQYHGTNGTLLAKGDIYAYYSFSDERLKQNVISLDTDKSLEQVLKLNPVEFEWKEAPDRGKQVGLIAQQVEQVVPEVVKLADRHSGEDEIAQYKHIDYDKLVPLLINSIKNLNARVIELEAKLEDK